MDRTSDKSLWAPMSMDRLEEPEEANNSAVECEGFWLDLVLRQSGCTPEHHHLVWSMKHVWRNVILLILIGCPYKSHLCHDTKHILHVELLWVCVYGFLSHRDSRKTVLDIRSWARSHGSPASDQPPKVSVCCNRKMPGFELACFGGIYVHICFTGNCIDIDWMTSAQLPANSWFVKNSKEVWNA